MAQWVKVAVVDEIPRGGSRVAEINGAMILIFNLDGEYYAIDDVCTHDGESLAGGDLEGDEVVCPRHGARFNVRTGEVMAPPAYEAVHAYPVRVQDSAIEVCDDRWD